jgi:hypothetical protein
MIDCLDVGTFGMAGFVWVMNIRDIECWWAF